MINLLCPINNTTGYGITSTNTWKELRKLTEVCIFPIGGVQLETNIDHPAAQEDIDRSMEGKSKDAPCLKIWHMHDLFSRVGSGTYGAFPFFEVDKLKPIEIACLGHTDVVFTASDWSKQVLIDNGIAESKIRVVPLAVDHNNVELWMVNHNPFLQEAQIAQWRDLYTNSKLGSKIKHFDRFNTHNELAECISQADCGIFPARAEGWNNEIPEVMAMNKPIITTNYSAHTAYCNDKNSYLIDIDELEPAVDGIWFDGLGKWAKLGYKQIEQMIEHMRYVYKNDIRDNINGRDTAKALTWANTAKIIRNELI
jgi:glycosyltransferase involved in cell wall biosynthesis